MAIVQMAVSGVILESAAPMPARNGSDANLEMWVMTCGVGGGFVKLALKSSQFEPGWLKPGLRVQQCMDAKPCA
eukprot:353939-Chlamydomonas_euryale.AAC.33